MELPIISLMLITRLGHEGLHEAMVMEVVGLH